MILTLPFDWCKQHPGTQQGSIKDLSLITVNNNLIPRSVYFRDHFRGILIREIKYSRKLTTKH